MRDEILCHAVRFASSTAAIQILLNKCWEQLIPFLCLIVDHLLCPERRAWKEWNDCVGVQGLLLSRDCVLKHLEALIVETRPSISSGISIGVNEKFDLQIWKGKVKCLYAPLPWSPPLYDDLRTNPLESVVHFARSDERTSSSRPSRPEQSYFSVSGEAISVDSAMGHGLRIFSFKRDSWRGLSISASISTSIS